jgi:hypothetical protein
MLGFRPLVSAPLTSGGIAAARLGSTQFFLGDVGEARAHWERLREREEEKGLRKKRERQAQQAEYENEQAQRAADEVIARAMERAAFDRAMRERGLNEQRQAARAERIINAVEAADAMQRDEDDAIALLLLM